MGTQMTPSKRMTAEELAKELVRGDWTSVMQYRETDIPTSDWEELERRISEAITQAVEEESKKMQELSELRIKQAIAQEEAHAEGVKDGSFHTRHADCIQRSIERVAQERERCIAVAIPFMTDKEHSKFMAAIRGGKLNYLRSSRGILVLFYLASKRSRLN